MSMLRLGFAGDVMLGRMVDRRQSGHPPAAVWGSMRPRLQELDGFVINLECVISRRGQRWTRTDRPFHFRADPEWAIPALEDAGVDCCALANNHMLDFEEVALRDTITHLDEAGIAYTGAGETLEAALEPAVFSLGDSTVAVISLTDNTPEYGATDDSPGVARIEMDVEDSRSCSLVEDALERVETQNPDITIASLHWGPNMVAQPADQYEEFGRWVVDAGVDFIHGHSAHVFQGVERYQGAPICYDMGDFVDDYAVDEELHNDRGFFFVLELVAGEMQELRLLPTQIQDCTVNEATGEVAEWSLHRMQQLSAEYGTDFIREGTELVLDST